MISNHGLEFLRAFHHQNYSFGLGPGQSDSMINMNALISADIVSKNKIDYLYRKIYFKHLVAIGYEADPKDPHRLVLYTHAPVPFRIIEDLCHCLHIKFDIENLPKTMYNINVQFLQIIQNKEKFDKYFPLIGNTAYTPDNPFDSLVWCRMDDEQDTLNLLRPEVILSYVLTYVHGHNNKGIVPKHKQGYVYNLDGMLGMWDNIVGEWAVLNSSIVI